MQLVLGGGWLLIYSYYSRMIRRERSGISLIGASLGEEVFSPIEHKKTARTEGKTSNPCQSGPLCMRCRGSNHRGIDLSERGEGLKRPAKKTAHPLFQRKPFLLQGPDTQ